MSPLPTGPGVAPMWRRLAAVLLAVPLLAGAVSLAGGAAAAADYGRYAVGDLKRLDFAAAGTPAPAVPFEAKAGKAVSLADFRGRVVVLNLWATWCAPCVKEMPSLDRLAASVDPRAVAVVTVSQDMAGWRAVDPFWARRGLKTLTPYIDKPNKLALALKAKGLPVTVIYDARGREVARLTYGAEWDSKAVKTLLAAVTAAG